MIFRQSGIYFLRHGVDTFADSIERLIQPACGEIIGAAIDGALWPPNLDSDLCTLPERTDGSHRHIGGIDSQWGAEGTFGGQDGRGTPAREQRCQMKTRYDRLR